MVGQEELARHIRGHAKKDIPKAWLFSGGRGLGKTTLARILALSVQCKHQKRFGEPCDKCWRRYERYPIFELNASDKNGVNDLREFVSTSQYDVIGGGRRVYILDEAHEISGAAQNMLLKYLEDNRNDTMWIILTTEPEKLKGTIRRRCIPYSPKPLKEAGIKQYVARLLKHTDLDGDRLTEELIENKIDSPGVVAMAAEKYAVGVDVAEAVQESTVEIDTKRLCKNLITGDWPAVSKQLQDSPATDARAIRASVLGYLRAIILSESEFNYRNKVLVGCIRRLAYMNFSDNLVIMSALTAELYALSNMFNKYKR